MQRSAAINILGEVDVKWRHGLPESFQVVHLLEIGIPVGRRDQMYLKRRRVVLEVAHDRLEKFHHVAALMERPHYLPSVSSLMRYSRTRAEKLVPLRAAASFAASRSVLGILTVIAVYSPLTRYSLISVGFASLRIMSA